VTQHRPAVGDVVHYVAHGTDTCSAAIITAVPEWLSKGQEPMDGCVNGTANVWEVNLVAFHPDGMGMNFPQCVRYDPTGPVATWHLHGQASQDQPPRGVSPF